MNGDFCCAMRRHFLFGIVGEECEPDNPAKAKPVPVEAVDFIEWPDGGGPPIVRIRFCPFCGKAIERGETRTTYFGRRKNEGGYES